MLEYNSLKLIMTASCVDCFIRVYFAIRKKIFGRGYLIFSILPCCNSTVVLVLFKLVLTRILLVVFAFQLFKLFCWQKWRLPINYMLVLSQVIC